MNASTSAPGTRVDQGLVIHVDDLAGVRDDIGPPTGVNLSLCALLVRDGYTLDDVLKRMECRKEFTWHAVDLSAIGHPLSNLPSPNAEVPMQVGVRRRPASLAPWKPFMRDLGVPVTDDEETSQESIIVAVRINAWSGQSRILLWCLGDISRSVPNSCTDNRFGLIAAINKHEAGSAISPWRTLPPGVSRRRVVGDPSARVRGLSHEARDGYRHRATTHSAGPAPIDGLRFDNVSDLLRGVSLRTEDALMNEIVGGRTLRFSTYVDSLKDLRVLADHVVALRDRDDYQGNWEWIDYVLPVTDRDVINEILDNLHAQILADENLAVDLMLSNRLCGDGINSRRILFGFPGESGTTRAAITWMELRRWLLRQSADQGSVTLRKNLRVTMEGYEKTSKEKCPIYENLVAEFEVSDESYILSDGEVLRVDRNFLQRIDSDLESSIAWSSFPFPTYQGGTEPNYLAGANERSHGRLAILDGHNIQLPGETSFEVCDLLSDDHRLIYGKLKGASKNFSHLCVQAETAAQILLRSSPARMQFLDHVSRVTQDAKLVAAAQEIAASLEERRSGSITITLLLLGSWRQRSLKSLPLVSKIRLRKTARFIEALGYNFEVASPDFDVKIVSG
jgi:uncharacterized protein (TIGR04141 family)